MAQVKPGLSNFTAKATFACPQAETNTIYQTKYLEKQKPLPSLDLENKMPALRMPLGQKVSSNGITFELLYLRGQEKGEASFVPSDSFQPFLSQPAREQKKKIKNK